MQRFGSCSLPLPSPPPFSGQLRPPKRVSGGGARFGITKISASKADTYSDSNYNGKRVDENMIVLRKRIHELKMSEEKDEPPLHWMGWERQYYANYNSDVLEIVGFLQSKLMDTRPGLALGMLALVLLSITTSMVALGIYVVGLIKGL